LVAAGLSCLAAVAAAAQVVTIPAVASTYWGTGGGGSSNAGPGFVVSGGSGSSSWPPLHEEEQQQQEETPMIAVIKRNTAAQTQARKQQQLQERFAKAGRQAALAAEQPVAPVILVQRRRSPRSEASRAGQQFLTQAALGRLEEQGVLGQMGMSAAQALALAQKRALGAAGVAAVAAEVERQQQPPSSGSARRRRLLVAQSLPAEAVGRRRNLLREVGDRTRPGGAVGGASVRDAAAAKALSSSSSSESPQRPRVAAAEMAPPLDSSTTTGNAVTDAQLAMLERLSQLKAASGEAAGAGRGADRRAAGARPATTGSSSSSSAPPVAPGRPPRVRLSAPASVLEAEDGLLTAVELDASESRAGVEGGLAFAWVVDKAGGAPGGGGSGSAGGGNSGRGMRVPLPLPPVPPSRVTAWLPGPGTYSVTLSVTDAAGLVSETSRTVVVKARQQQGQQQAPAATGEAAAVRSSSSSTTGSRQQGIWDASASEYDDLSRARLRAPPDEEDAFDGGGQRGGGGGGNGGRRGGGGGGRGRAGAGGGGYRRYYEGAGEYDERYGGPSGLRTRAPQQQGGRRDGRWQGGGGGGGGGTGNRRRPGGGGMRAGLREAEPEGGKGDYDYEYVDTVTGEPVGPAAKAHAPSPPTPAAEPSPPPPPPLAEPPAAPPTGMAAFNVLPPGKSLFPPPAPPPATSAPSQPQDLAGQYQRAQQQLLSQQGSRGVGSQQQQQPGLQPQQPLMSMSSPTSAAAARPGGSMAQMPTAQALFGASPLGLPGTAGAPPPASLTLNSAAPPPDALPDAAGIFAPTPVVDRSGRVVGQGYVAAGPGGAPTLVSQSLQPQGVGGGSGGGGGMPLPGAAAWSAAMATTAPQQGPQPVSALQQAYARQQYASAGSNNGNGAGFAGGAYGGAGPYAGAGGAAAGAAGAAGVPRGFLTAANGGLVSSYSPYASGNGVGVGGGVLGAGSLSPYAYYQTGGGAQGAMAVPQGPTTALPGPYGAGGVLAAAPTPTAMATPMQPDSPSSMSSDMGPDGRLTMSYGYNAAPTYRSTEEPRILSPQLVLEPPLVVPSYAAPDVLGSKMAYLRGSDAPEASSIVPPLLSKKQLCYYVYNGSYAASAQDPNLVGFGGSPWQKTPPGAMVATPGNALKAMGETVLSLLRGKKELLQHKAEGLGISGPSYSTAYWAPCVVPGELPPLPGQGGAFVRPPAPPSPSPAPSPGGQPPSPGGGGDSGVPGPGGILAVISSPGSFVNAPVGAAEATALLDGSSSTPAQGGGALVSWSWLVKRAQDGQVVRIASGRVATVTLPAGASYVVELVVRDGAGNADGATQTTFVGSGGGGGGGGGGSSGGVGSGGTAVISLPQDVPGAAPADFVQQSYEGLTAVQLIGTGSQPLPGRSIVSYEWAAKEIASGLVVDAKTGPTAVVGLPSGSYQVALTTTDNAGGKATATRVVYVGGQSPAGGIAVITQPTIAVAATAGAAAGAPVTVNLDSAGSRAPAGSGVNNTVWAIVLLPGRQSVVNATSKFVQVPLNSGEYEVGLLVRDTGGQVAFARKNFTVGATAAGAGGGSAGMLSGAGGGSSPGGGDAPVTATSTDDLPDPALPDLVLPGGGAGLRLAGGGGGGASSPSLSSAEAGAAQRQAAAPPLPRTLPKVVTLPQGASLVLDAAAAGILPASLEQAPAEEEAESGATFEQRQLAELERRFDLRWALLPKSAARLAGREAEAAAAAVAYGRVARFELRDVPPGQYIARLAARPAGSAPQSKPSAVVSVGVVVAEPTATAVASSSSSSSATQVDGARVDLGGVGGDGCGPFFASALGNAQLSCPGATVVASVVGSATSAAAAAADRWTWRLTRARDGGVVQGTGRTASFGALQPGAYGVTLTVAAPSAAADGGGGSSSSPPPVLLMLATQLLVAPPRLDGLPSGGAACAGRDLTVSLPASALSSSAFGPSSTSSSPLLRGQAYSWRVDWIDGKALTGYDQAVTAGGPKLAFRLQPGRQVVTLTLSSGGAAPVVTSATVDGVPCVECKQEAAEIAASPDACSADPAAAPSLLRDAPWGVRVSLRAPRGLGGLDSSSSDASSRALLFGALSSSSSSSSSSSNGVVGRGGGPLSPGGGARAVEVVASTPSSGVEGSCVARNVTVVDRTAPRVSAVSPAPCLSPSDRWACWRPWELVRATDNCAAQRPMAFLARCAGGAAGAADCTVTRDGRACVRAALARGAASDKVVPVDVSVRDGWGNEAEAVRVGVVVRAGGGAASAGCRAADLDAPPPRAAAREVGERWSSSSGAAVAAS
jgi:PKD repeat protein